MFASAQTYAGIDLEISPDAKAQNEEKPMAESVDYKLFRKHVVQYGDRLDRIENVLIPGMPDINFCSGGVESWIEQKSPREPVRSTTPLFGSNHRVSQEQMNWFLRQTKAGGRAFFLVSTNKRWMLLIGTVAEWINKMTIEDLLNYAVWTTAKPVRDGNEWLELRNTLRRR